MVSFAELRRHSYGQFNHAVHRRHSYGWFYHVVLRRHIIVGFTMLYLGYTVMVASPCCTQEVQLWWGLSCCT